MKIRMCDCPKCNRPHLADLIEACNGLCPLCREKEEWARLDREEWWGIVAIVASVGLMAAVVAVFGIIFLLLRG
jgi:hypothetical protein